MKRIIDISDRAYNEALTVKEISDIKDLSCETRAKVFLAIQNSTPLEQEPRKGHWDIKDNMWWVCSACGCQTRMMKKYNVPNFCPACGAKMESEDKE